MGSSTPHFRSKLLALCHAGETGVPAQAWRQSELTVPLMLERGWMVKVSRMEPVDYYVITPLGRSETGVTSDDPLSPLRQDPPVRA